MLLYLQKTVILNIREVIEIDKDLQPIRGIDKAIMARLAEQGIYNVADLQKHTRLIKDREELAKETKINSKSLYIWAKQADLMRVEEIDAVASELLVKSGVRNVGELAAINTKTLLRLIEVSFNNDNIAYKTTITLSDLEAWKKAAAALDAQIENNPDDEPLELLFVKSTADSGAFKKLDYSELFARAASSDDTTVVLEKSKENAQIKELSLSKIAEPKVKEGGFFFGLTEMMVEIGRGVATAQHELDMSSIEIQEYIDSSETLANYGLAATWYVLPETSVTMKVDYTVVQEETEDDGINDNSKLPIHLRVAPVNAKYKNYFKSSTSLESELNFKIVPVPPPTIFTDAVFVPDIIGLSLEEAIQQIKEARLLVGDITCLVEKPQNGKETQVVSQSKEPGTETAVNDVIGIIYMKEG